MADDNKNDVPVVNPASASGLAKWLEIAKKVGIGLGILIGTILTVAASGGLTLPPGLIVALNAILALLAAAGLASPGLKPLSIPSQKGPPSDP